MILGDVTLEKRYERVQPRVGFFSLLGKPLNYISQAQQSVFQHEHIFAEFRLLFYDDIYLLLKTVAAHCTLQIIDYITRG